MKLIRKPIAKHQVGMEEGQVGPDMRSTMTCLVWHRGEQRRQAVWVMRVIASALQKRRGNVGRHPQRSHMEKASKEAKARSPRLTLGRDTADDKAQARSRPSGRSALSLMNLWR